MKISKKSWHYKIWAYKRTKYKKQIPPNLCTYFWTVMFKVLVSIPFMWVFPLVGGTIDEDYDLDIRPEDERRFIASLFVVWIALLYSYLVLPWTWISEAACWTTWLITCVIGGCFIAETIEVAGKKVFRALGWAFDSGILHKPIHVPIVDKAASKGWGFLKIAIETIKNIKGKACPNVEII